MGNHCFVFIQAAGCLYPGPHRGGPAHGHYAQKPGSSGAHLAVHAWFPSSWNPGRTSHSPECDMYSLAIPMWQLETKEDPFFGQHPQTVIFLILVEAKPPPTPYQKELLSMVGHAADYFQPDYMGVNITGIQSSFSYSRKIKQVLPSIFLLLF